ncbi:MAG: V-type ATP synthase subunit D [Simkaniaceae bacterium]|nr:V-type ATP synthase subunit D [Simkaniaceae bacterium]
MTTVKLTKNELRTQEHRHKQLMRYLPTLQLKKALLQAEVNHAEAEIEQQNRRYHHKLDKVMELSKLFADRSMRDFFSSAKIEEVLTESENIAGVEVPIFKDVRFMPTVYSVYDTPYWWDSAMDRAKETICEKEKVEVAKQKKALLEKELREVSIRVNLFEKILIPRTEANIKKIKVFLGDQQLAAVAQAKVAKEKILQKKMKADDQ